MPSYVSEFHILNYHLQKNLEKIAPFQLVEVEIYKSIHRINLNKILLN